MSDSPAPERPLYEAASAHETFRPDALGLFTRTELAVLRNVARSLEPCTEDPRSTAVRHVRAALEVFIGRRSVAAQGRDLLSELVRCDGRPAHGPPCANDHRFFVISSPIDMSGEHDEAEYVRHELRDVALRGVASVAVASEVELLLRITKRQYMRAQVVVMRRAFDEQVRAEIERFAGDYDEALMPTSVAAEGLDEATKATYRSSVSTTAESLRALLLPTFVAQVDAVNDRLRLDRFVVQDVEIQYTVSVVGDHYGVHTDNVRSSGAGALSTRLLTFVYYFHDEPKAFSGGELRVHDTAYVRDRPISSGSFVDIVPESNMMVFFDAGLLHEVLPVQSIGVELDKRSARRTINGWLHGVRYRSST